MFGQSFEQLRLGLKGRNTALCLGFLGPAGKWGIRIWDQFGDIESAFSGYEEALQAASLGEDLNVLPGETCLSVDLHLCQLALDSGSQEASSGEN